MLLSKKTPQKRVASIILAGGQGTRLYPLTAKRCKPAVCFAGRYRLIDIPISNAMNAKIEEIFIISQYLASSLHQHILETYPFDPFRTSRIHLISPEEKNTPPLFFKGTADAIRQNREQLEAADVDFFLILSGDQLYNIDFVELLSFAKEINKDLVIASLPVESQEAHRMGLLKIDENHQIIDFIEKPKDPAVVEKYVLPSHKLQGHALSHPNHSHCLASMGIYIFKKQALLDLVKLPGDDFGKDLIPLAVRAQKAASYVYKGYWEDIGTISSYYKANMALLSQKHCLNTQDPLNPIFTHSHNYPSPLIKKTFIQNSLISQGSVVEAEEVIDSIIGMNLHIGSHTKVQKSILLGSSIGTHCLIKNTILDEGARLGNHVSLTNVKQLDNYDSEEGLFIREGIIVVSSGSIIPDGFIL